MESQIQNGFICYHCHKKIPVFGPIKIARTEECPYCSTSLHCCKMCKFFDSTVYNECLESNAERIVDKEKANFCDYFNLSSGTSNKASREDLLKSADSLFKK
jgi:hypothetical protein